MTSGKSNSTWAKDPISNFISRHPLEARHIQDEVKQRIDTALADLEAEGSSSGSRDR